VGGTTWPPPERRGEIVVFWRPARQIRDSPSTRPGRACSRSTRASTCSCSSLHVTNWVPGTTQKVVVVAAVEVPDNQRRGQRLARAAPASFTGPSRSREQIRRFHRTEDGKLPSAAHATLSAGEPASSFQPCPPRRGDWWSTHAIRHRPGTQGVPFPRPPTSRSRTSRIGDETARASAVRNGMPANAIMRAALTAAERSRRTAQGRPSRPRLDPASRPACRPDGRTPSRARVRQAP